MNGEQENKISTGINPLTNNTEPNPNLGEQSSLPPKIVTVQEALKQEKPLADKVSTVRTFQSDIAGTVRSDNVSMIKIALAEKERRESGSQIISIADKPRFKPVYVVVSLIILLIIIGLGGLYWYLNKPAGPTLEQIIAPNEPEIIYTEKQTQVKSDNRPFNLLLEDLRKEAMVPLDLGTMKRILVTTRSGEIDRNLNSSEFLKAIRARANDSFLSSIDPYFVLGAYAFAPQDVFIIFKVNSYDIAYPGMLAFEEYMDIDLSPLLAEPEKPVETPPVQEEQLTTLPVENSSTTNSTTTVTDNTDNSNIISTSTIQVTNTTNTSITPKREKLVWKDRIIQNKDTRVLLDSQNNIKFFYSFIDKNTLVIVSSEKAFKEIITRMTTGRVRR